MLEFNAAAFYEVTRRMQHTLTHIETTQKKSVEMQAGGGATITPITNETFLGMMQERNADLRAALKVLGASITLMAVQDLDRVIAGRYPTYEDFIAGYKEISRTLSRELTHVKLLSLNNEEQSLFEPPDPLFGTNFESKFATRGVFELDEAAKCRALGRPTAAVFHLMRVMEVGIQALAQFLGIPDPVKPAERNWSVILRKIMSDGIEKKWPTAANRMQPDAVLCEALHASLDAVKNPFRNATMHVESKYTDAEAQHIFALVKGFMTKLSERMDEDGQPRA